MMGRLYRSLQTLDEAFKKDSDGGITEGKMGLRGIQRLYLMVCLINYVWKMREINYNFQVSILGNWVKANSIN